MSTKKLSLTLYDGYILPQNRDFYQYQHFREAVDYEPKESDVFVVSYPKSGTTWTQYIVWEILTDAEEPPYVNEMWFTLAPQIEMFGSKKLLQTTPVRSGHRQIKSHMPFEYIPYNSKGKYIYIARNPYEVCLSYYKDVRNSPNIFGEHSFEEWVELFLKGYTAFGDYFDHIILWFKQRNRENVLFITYEELKDKPKEHILKIAEFIGKEFRQNLEENPGIFDKIVYYTDFNYMKGIPFILPNDFDEAKNAKGLDAKKNLNLTKNGSPYRLHDFFHEGKVGHSYDKFTDNQIKRIKEKVNEKFSQIPELLQIWKSFGIKL